MSTKSPGSGKRLGLGDLLPLVFLFMIAAMPTKLWLILPLLVLARLLKSKPLPPRETIIPSNEERVLLLGASSGVGRDLAHTYARRGAKICIVARRKDELERVKQECLDIGLASERILVFAGDITSVSELVAVRDLITKNWGRLDTLHILAGLPSTDTLLGPAGVRLDSVAGQSSSGNGKRREFQVNGTSYADTVEGLPSQAGLELIAADARRCAEVNFVGTLLSLSCFLPLLSSSSAAPAVHHLSSVAATIPAPHRVIYSATKAAGFMAMESARVECEGCGVRFFSLLPGTIANDFRLKTSSTESGGRDETRLDIKHDWEKLLLAPQKVVDTIMHNLSMNPAPAPSIPYPPFSWFRALDSPPPRVVHLPQTYRWATLASWTPLGWWYIEPSARRKYGLPGR